jgi:hypothetical protein
MGFESFLVIASYLKNEFEHQRQSHHTIPIAKTVKQSIARVRIKITIKALP